MRISGGGTTRNLQSKRELITQILLGSPRPAVCTRRRSQQTSNPTFFCIIVIHIYYCTCEYLPTCIPHLYVLNTHIPIFFAACRSSFGVMNEEAGTGFLIPPSNARGGEPGIYGFPPLSQCFWDYVRPPDLGDEKCHICIISIRPAQIVFQPSKPTIVRSYLFRIPWCKVYLLSV